MFSPQSPTRTNIEEANKHLELLHSRVTELEDKTAQQEDALATFKQKQQEWEEQSRNKDVEIGELRVLLEAATKKLNELRHHNEQKDVAIRHMKGKCKHMAEIISYQPMLQNLVASMAKVNFDGSQENNVRPQRPHTDQHKHILNGDGESGARAKSESVASRPKSIKSRTAAYNHRQLLASAVSGSDDEYDGDEDNRPDKAARKLAKNKELYL